jgi:hypothetical protein
MQQAGDKKIIPDKNGQITASKQKPLQQADAVQRVDPDVIKELRDQYRRH